MHTNESIPNEKYLELGWYSKLGSQLPLWNDNFKKDWRKTYWHFYTAKMRLNCNKKIQDAQPLSFSNHWPLSNKDKSALSMSDSIIQKVKQIFPRAQLKSKWSMCYTCATLTLYSVDIPLSVSRRELQGNCPVTLYTLTEKLKHNITGRF